MARFTLFDKAAHPRSSTLRWAAKIVTIPQSQWLSVVINDLKNTHVGMISGQIFTFFEGQSINPVGRIEHAIHQNAVDIEIGFHVVFGEMKLLLLHLCRIKHAVVGL